MNLSFAKTPSMMFLLFSLLICMVIGIPQTSQDVEERVVTQLKGLVQSGKPVIVSKLYNEVFTSPAERKVIDRLYNIFFKVPLFLTQYYKNSRRPPTLAELSEQFSLKVKGEADLILSIMESDPRVPKFVSRDAQTGEITRIDIQKIQSDPRFNKIIERSIAGWEGKVAPPFTVHGLDGSVISSSDMRDKTYLVYFWFTHCPPCGQIMGNLVSLQDKFKSRDFTVIGLNADRLLELDYDDAERNTYLLERRVNFSNAHLTAEVQASYGGVQLFPTLFLVDKQGIIRSHFVNYQEENVMEKAIEEIL